MCQKLLEKKFVLQNCTLISSKLKKTKYFLLNKTNYFCLTKQISTPTKKITTKIFHLQNKNLAVM